MSGHPFNFAGGEDLATMGASWFVSYHYHGTIDPAHENWRNCEKTLTGIVLQKMMKAYTTRSAC